MVFFPNGLQQTQRILIEKVEEGNVDMRMEIAVKPNIDKRKYEEDDFEHHIISTDKPRQPACYTSVAHKKAYQNNEKRQNGNVCSYLKVEAQCVESCKRQRLGIRFKSGKRHKADSKKQSDNEENTHYNKRMF